MNTRIATIILVVLLGLVATPALAKKTDVIVMDNGNRLVGEIKKLDQGLLELSMTDIKGRVRVEWNHVVRVVSTKYLDIELRSGARFYGSLIESDADGILRVLTVVGEFDVDCSNVVTFEPIRSTFWRRLTGNVSTGLSFIKATEILQFNFGGTVRHRTEEAETELSINTIITARSGEKTTNTDVPLTHQRFFANKWFYQGDLAGSRNDELGIDFRGSIGAGGGRRLIQTNSTIGSVSMLISGNREFTSDGNITNNLELVLDTSLLTFRYDSPKLEISIDASGFLNLTNWGRYRAHLDGRISLELVTDLFWDISQVYYRYDSDPSETATSTNDWGVVSGIRYTFN